MHIMHFKSIFKFREGGGVVSLVGPNNFMSFYDSLTFYIAQFFTSKYIYISMLNWTKDHNFSVYFET